LGKVVFLFDSDSGIYWILVLGAGLGFILVSWAKQYLQRTFSQCGGVPAACGLTGASAARRLLAAVGLAPVGVVRSSWLNCYHPRKREVQLRDETFDGSTIASLAIAAHEVGHAQQFASGYWPARMRLWIRPIYVGLLLAMVGLTAYCLAYLATPLEGFIVVGVAFVMLLVQLPAVLPLEYDASRRAKELVLKEALLAPYEEKSFDRLLKACGRTYLAWECQRWVLLLAAGAAVVWMTPVLSADPRSELTPVEPAAAPERGCENGDSPPKIQGDSPLFRTRAERPDQEVEPGAAVLPADDEPAPLVDLSYVLLSSLGTLIPASLLVLLVAKYGRTSGQRPTSHATAVSRNNAGMKLMQRGELAGAVEAFSSALQLDAKLHAAYFNRGMCHLKQGQFDKAMSDIEACLLLNPDFVEALAMRGQIWTLQGQYELAVADLNQALQMAPRNAVALTSRGNLGLVQGDHERARADFEQALASDPQHGSAYLGRSKIELARGNTDAALADCCQAMAYEADAGDAHSLRGHIWLEKREYDRAIADFTACFKIFPEQGWLLCNRGLAYYLKGDYPRALADLDKAVELDPADAFAYNNRGAAHLKAGNFAAARTDLQKALELKPDFPNPHKHLAWLQATCPVAEFRDGASAVGHAQRALELAPKDIAEYQAVLAAAYAEAGEYARAVEWQARCLEGSRPEAVAPMRERLQLYESGRAFRCGAET
jgi:tetratricopeptide (TPR) repeat protein